MALTPEEKKRVFKVCYQSKSGAIANITILEESPDVGRCYPELEDFVYVCKARRCLTNNKPVAHLLGFRTKAYRIQEITYVRVEKYLNSLPTGGVLSMADVMRSRSIMRRRVLTLAIHYVRPY